jgi:hypothetical protein
MLQYQCEQLDKKFRWWFFNGSLVPGLSTCFDTVIMWDASEITQEPNTIKANSHIGKNTFDYLKPDNPKAGRFYLLPKFHKVNKHGRPIISANSSVGSVSSFL